MKEFEEAHDAATDLHTPGEKAAHNTTREYNLKESSKSLIANKTDNQNQENKKIGRRLQGRSLGTA